MSCDFHFFGVRCSFGRVVFWILGVDVVFWTLVWASGHTMRPCRLHVSQVCAGWVVGQRHSLFGFPCVIFARPLRSSPTCHTCSTHHKLIAISHLKATIRGRWVCKSACDHAPSFEDVRPKKHAPRSSERAVCNCRRCASGLAPALEGTSAYCKHTPPVCVGGGQHPLARIFAKIQPPPIGGTIPKICTARTVLKFSMCAEICCPITRHHSVQ